MLSGEEPLAEFGALSIATQATHSAAADAPPEAGGGSLQAEDLCF